MAGNKHWQQWVPERECRRQEEDASIAEPWITLNTSAQLNARSAKTQAMPDATVPKREKGKRSLPAGASQLLEPKMKLTKDKWLVI